MKTMKKFAALMMLLCALMICTIPALAANESDNDSNVTETVNVTAGSNDNDVTSAKAMGSGVMIGIACLGGRAGDGYCRRQVERGHGPPARSHKSDQNHDDDGPCVYRDGHHLRPDRGDPHYLRPLMKNTPKKEGL